MRTQISILSPGSTKVGSDGADLRRPVRGAVLGHLLAETERAPADVRAAAALTVGVRHVA